MPMAVIGYKPAPSRAELSGTRWNSPPSSRHRSADEEGSYGNKEVWTCDGCLEGLQQHLEGYRRIQGKGRLPGGTQGRKCGGQESVLAALLGPRVMGSACVPGCESSSVIQDLNQRRRRVSG